MKQYGAFVSLTSLSALLISGFIITAGCSALLVEKGPLPRYLSSHPIGTITQTPDALPPDNLSRVLLTPDPAVTQEVTVTQDIPARSTLNPNTYHPLDVTILPGDAPKYRTYEFRYRTDDYTVSLPVNQSLYRAANQSTNRDLVIDNTDLESFYRQMTGDPALDPFYDDISRELRRMRYKDGKTLLDDEYLELLVSFVQQIPAEEATRTPQYPIEVVSDRKGTSEEKSILLTKLLAHEGYDTGFLIFTDRKHVTAGIRIHLVTSSPSFRVFSDGKRDYLYIESSTSRLIGMYPEEYETAPDPVVITVGKGTILYTKIKYVAGIMYDLKTIKTNIQSLNLKAEQANGTLYSWDAEALASYLDTYDFVLSTNDRLAAREAIQESELPHHSACMSCN